MIPTILGSRRLAVALAILLGLTAVPQATAQDQRDEWFYMPGSFNWQFLGTYPTAARLFNAFDYGHAVLYERLYTGRGDARQALEKEYRYLTTDLLVRPPRFAVVEEAVSPSYAKVAWRAKQMFDWAHLLHRQIFDIYSDDRLDATAKDSLIERVTDYYLARRKYAFAPAPKSMDLMEGQYFSKSFRRAYPEFNGLIWAYHWLQVGLYEPLIEGKTPPERKAGVDAAVARFWTMLEEPPTRMPSFMPMAAAIAPRFSERHPRAAAIFDNLHMMHDIISDILTTDAVPHDRKREAIYEQLGEFQDSTRNVMSWDEWRGMADMMGGIAVMGGPATGLVASGPTPPAPEMGGMQHGMGGRRMDAGPSPMGDSMPMPGAGPQPDSGMTHGEHGEGGHVTHQGAAPQGHRGADSGHVERMKQLHARLMADPVIRRRLEADTALHRLILEMTGSAYPEAKPVRPSEQPHAPAPRPAPGQTRTPREAGDTMPHHHQGSGEAHESHDAGDQRLTRPVSPSGGYP